MFGTQAISILTAALSNWIELMNKPHIKNIVFEPSFEDIDRIVRRITTLSQDSLISRSWFVYGYGKHPKSTYVDLEQRNYEVIWYGVKGPFWAKVLSPVIATYYGLIKVRRSPDIAVLVDCLSKNAMVGLFSVLQDKEKAFVSEISNGNADPDDYLKENDPSYFGFLLDGDNRESKSGFLVILQYGPNCPKELKDFALSHTRPK